MRTAFGGVVRQVLNGRKRTDFCAEGAKPRSSCEAKRRRSGAATRLFNEFQNRIYYSQPFDRLPNNSFEYFRKFSWRTAAGMSRFKAITMAIVFAVKRCFPFPIRSLLFSLSPLPALLLLAEVPPSAWLDAQLVEIKISSSAAATGTVCLAVFDCPLAFERSEAKISQVVAWPKGQTNLRLSIPVLPRGNYAIAAFHDLNNNGKLDRNLWGIPTEPYGFSKEPTNKWQKPAWEDVLLPIKPSTKQLAITLKTWKERD